MKRVEYWQSEDGKKTGTKEEIKSYETEQDVKNNTIKKLKEIGVNADIVMLNSAVSVIQILSAYNKGVKSIELYNKDVDYKALDFTRTRNGRCFSDETRSYVKKYILENSHLKPISIVAFFDGKISEAFVYLLKREIKEEIKADKLF